MIHMKLKVCEALSRPTLLLSDWYTYTHVQDTTPGAVTSTCEHQLLFSFLGEEALNEYLKTKSVTLEY